MTGSKLILPGSCLDPANLLDLIETERDRFRRWHIGQFGRAEFRRFTDVETALLWDDEIPSLAGWYATDTSEQQ